MVVTHSLVSHVFCRRKISDTMVTQGASAFMRVSRNLFSLVCTVQFVLVLLLALLLSFLALLLVLAKRPMWNDVSRNFSIRWSHSCDQDTQMVIALANWLNGQIIYATPRRAAMIESHE